MFRSLCYVLSVRGLFPLFIPASCTFRVLCSYALCVSRALIPALSLSFVVTPNLMLSITLMTILTPDAAPGLTLDCLDLHELSWLDLSLDWNDWFNLILTWPDLIWLIVPTVDSLCRVCVLPCPFRRRDHLCQHDHSKTWRRCSSFHRYSLLIPIS